MATSVMNPKQVFFIINILIISALVSCDRPSDEVNAPVAAVAATPSGGFTTTTFVFDCSQTESGNKNDKLYFRWDWNHDGDWDTEYSADPVFKYRFLTSGMQEPVAEVLNSSGLIDTCRLKLNIEQGYSAPRALFSVDPKAGNRLTEYVFNATFTKDDEDSLNLLQFRWDWEGDDRWDTGFSAVSVAKHSYYETGYFQPLLEVRDPSGLLSRYQSNLEVTQTNLRLYAHFDWTPVHPLQNDEVVFNAGLSRNLDDASDHLLYYWKFETGEPLKSGGWLGPFEEPAFVRSFSMEIDYLATLRVVDGQGLENQIERRVKIYHQNRPPVPRFHISTRFGNLTTQFLVNAWITNDIEDLPSTLQVRWDFNGDNRWDTEYSRDKILYHRFDAPGAYRIVLEAMDTEGLTDTTSVHVNVTPGTNETGLLIDRRFEGEEYYPTVKIGNQWWIARNMYFEPGILSDKIDTLRSVCYDQNVWPETFIHKNCAIWGRLYTVYSASGMNLREGAQGICPNGWHVPTKGEWETLITTIGGYSAAAELLPGGSADFNAQYAGWGEEVWRYDGAYRYKDWDFKGFGSITYFWSSTPLRGQGAVSHWNLTLIKGNDEISRGYSANSSFMSVRCLKNE